MQQVLASPSNYDLVNVIKNNVLGATPFTSRNIRITNIIHDHDVAARKKNDQGTNQEAKSR